MRLILIHQHDPTVNHVGGIGTFINTFVKYAPADFDIDLVGVTADPAMHPVGRWQQVTIGNHRCDFLPLVAASPHHRGRIPLSARLTAALARSRGLVEFGHAILEFHRIEPTIAVGGLKNPKVLFLHAHMQDLYNPKTEVAWGRFPWLYFWLERRLIQDLQRIYIVREDAVAFYRARYPALAERITFLPTWVDEEVFVSLPEPDRARERAALARAHGFDPATRLLLFVGRFEGQKDPLGLLETFRHLNGLRRHTRLVMIGEGSLEAEIRIFLAAHGLTESVMLLGPQSPHAVSRWMNVADCLVLSSAFEGMPRVVVEALRCGLPVVSPDVGEARRLIQDGRTGRLVRPHTPDALREAIAQVLQEPPDRQACFRQVAPYAALKVLEPVYQDYRQLHHTPR